MSASANNARSSSMPPPPAIPPVRKTLVEQGGEPYKPKPAHSNPRSINAVGKATSIAGPSRQNSSSFSSSYQSSAPSNRHASFSTSVGPGARQPTAQSHRSQSAMANSRLQRPTPNSSRPVTALEIHPETSSVSQGEKKRKGMLPISSITRNNSTRLEIKQSYDTQLNHNSNWASRPCSQASSREVSISTAFSGLSIHSKTQSTPVVDLKALSTPSQLPKRNIRVTMSMETPSPSKSPRKASSFRPFLTRDSHTRAASWGEPEDRLSNVEKDMNKFKENLEGMNVMRDTIDVYKARRGFMKIADNEAFLMLKQ